STSRDAATRPPARYATACRPRPSFPTRRSSDLPQAVFDVLAHREPPERRVGLKDHAAVAPDVGDRDAIDEDLAACRCEEPGHRRSEEHTSELQSPDHLVCRLLLHQRNKNRTTNT